MSARRPRRLLSNFVITALGGGDPDAIVHTAPERVATPMYSVQRIDTRRRGAHWRTCSVPTSQYRDARSTLRWFRRQTVPAIRFRLIVTEQIRLSCVVIGEGEIA